MPSSSTISSSDKSKVKSTLPSSSNKILTATVARIFVAYPNPSKWSYTGIEGALAFVRDLDRNTFALKVVDLQPAKNSTVIWEHELYEPLHYTQDRTHFHMLEGDDYMIGFAFADDGEANELYKKIQNRQKFAKNTSSSSSKKKNRGSKLLGGGGSKNGSSSGGKIDKSMISSPSDFKHVAHMGYTAEKGFSAENVDPSWSALLDQLSNMGISRADIQKNEGFIKDFVGKRGGVPKTPARTTPTTATKVKKVPPPAPSRAGTTTRKQPPPPPAPRARPGATSSTINSAAAAAPLAPPPPPARSGASSIAAPPPPPPPPARGTAGSSNIPPPPPPPARGSAANQAAPPPPPPPPMSSGSNVPPPPPPPPTSSSLPPAQAGRANLLASIQGQGVHNLRKTDPAAVGAGAAVGGSAVAAAAMATSDETNGGGDSGADLASALAAALSQRKDNMGDSDEDAESEEEW